MVYRLWFSNRATCLGRGDADVLLMVPVRDPNLVDFIVGDVQEGRSQDR